MESSSRDGRIHGDVLLALVLEVSAHFLGGERAKTPIRPTLVFSRRALAMWDSRSRTGDCKLASRQLGCAARSDRAGSFAKYLRKPCSEAVLDRLEEKATESGDSPALLD